MGDLELLIDSGDLTLLLVKDAFQLLLELPLIIFKLLGKLLSDLLLLLVELLDLLVEHFDMELQLLLNLDMVSYLGLILLKLLLVLLGRQVYGFECGGEPCLIQVTTSANTTTSV